MSMFGFTTNPTILINFNNQETRLCKKVRTQQGQPLSQDVIIYSGIENIHGTVEVSLPPGKKLEHLGIKIELIGQIEPYYDRGNNVKFLSLVREIDVPGILSSSSHSPVILNSSSQSIHNNATGNIYPFEFSTEKPYESYSGLNIQLRYFVRVTITRNYGNNFVKERDFFIQNYQVMNTTTNKGASSLSSSASAIVTTDSGKVTRDITTTPSTTTNAVAIASTQPSLNNPLHFNNTTSSSPPQTPTIKMEVGIEDCLHIEFEYDKSKYHLHDVILAIIRRETCGNGANIYNESENIIKYELMDGVPVKGENIPIRLYLSSFDLTPTYRSVHNLFSIKYYLNLVLVDEEDRRYFKQQEVIFYRQSKKENDDDDECQ